MKCKYCGCIESKVVDSRVSDGYRSIRRRRESALLAAKDLPLMRLSKNLPFTLLKKEAADKNSIYKKLGPVL